MSVAWTSSSVWAIYKPSTSTSHKPHVCLVTDVRRAFYGRPPSVLRTSAVRSMIAPRMIVEISYTWFTEPRVSTYIKFLTYVVISIIRDSLNAPLEWSLFPMQYEKIDFLIFSWYFAVVTILVCTIQRAQPSLACRRQAIRRNRRKWKFNILFMMKLEVLYDNQ